MKHPRALSAAALAALLLTPVAAKAQPTPPSRAAERHSLRSRFGVEAARPLLRAEASEKRRRAFERLGVAGTPRAIELLARSLDGDGAARDAKERLFVVRALARHASDPAAADALVRALGGALGRGESKDLLVERTAALALAASHDPGALRALTRALRQPGRVSEHARLALAAHRPPSIKPLLDAPGAPSPALVTLLGQLGDTHARPLVEKLATDGPTPLRTVAIPALFALDSARAVALAHAAFESETEPSVRAALARVLALSHDPQAPRALAALLALPATRSAALELALAAPSPELGPVLAAAPLGGDADRLFAALGRAGGAAALGRLERALTSAEDAWSALYALALAPDPNADAVLERALTRPALTRDALRAAALRAAALDRTISGTGAALTTLARGSALDRATAAWCRTVLEPESAAEAFASREPALIRAVGRAAVRPALAREAARRLAAETDPSLQSALASALATPEAADLVPTSTLVTLLELRGAASYVAAYALATRDSTALRSRVRELFASHDPVLRAHTALGLGSSAEPSAVGLLADTYRSEVDATVRRAIVTALAARTEPARLRTLELASALEPDDEARARARAALEREKRPSLPSELGPSSAASARSGTLWLRLGVSEAPLPFVLVEGPGGIALPFSSDSDGSVTVAGLAPGPTVFTLAPAAPGRIR